MSPLLHGLKLRSIVEPDVDSFCTFIGHQSSEFFKASGQKPLSTEASARAFPDWNQMKFSSPAFLNCSNLQQFEFMGLQISVPGTTFMIRDDTSGLTFWI